MVKIINSCSPTHTSFGDTKPPPLLWTQTRQLQQVIKTLKSEYEVFDWQWVLSVHQGHTSKSLQNITLKTTPVQSNTVQYNSAAVTSAFTKFIMFSSCFKIKLYVYWDHSWWRWCCTWFALYSDFFSTIINYDVTKLYHLIKHLYIWKLNIIGTIQAVFKAEKMYWIEWYCSAVF